VTSSASESRDTAASIRELSHCCSRHRPYRTEPFSDFCTTIQDKYSNYPIPALPGQELSIEFPNKL